MTRPQFVFRFTLQNMPWQNGPFGYGPPSLRDKILTRPPLAGAGTGESDGESGSVGRAEWKPPAPGSWASNRPRGASRVS